MYISYNEKNKEFRLYFDVNDNVEEFVNKYKHNDKSIWKWDNCNGCYKSKYKSAIIKCYRFFDDTTTIKNKKEIEEYKNKITKTQKTYYKKNKNKIIKTQKTQYEKDKNKILNKKKIYYKKNKNEIANKKKTDKKTNKAKYMYIAARARAKQKKLDFNLTIKQLEQKFEEIKGTDGFYYCPALLIRLDVNDTIRDNSFSLDRIDNTKGYTVDNICIVSYKFNNLKSDITLEFIHKLEKYFSLEDFKYSKLYDISENFKKKKLCSIKKRPKKQNIDFNLELGDIKIPKIDFFGNIISIEKDCLREEQASCDRIDPNKGYIKNNIRWISMKSNRIKGGITPETLDIIKNYIKKFGK